MDTLFKCKTANKINKLIIIFELKNRESNEITIKMIINKIHVCVKQL
jgi:hypothetical protein